MGAPKCTSAAFRHADVTEFALLDELNKRLDDLFNGDIGRDAGTFEEVHLLGASEGLINAVYTASQVFRSAQLCIRLDRTWCATVRTIHPARNYELDCHPG